MLDNAKGYKEVNKIIDTAKKEGIIITSNESLIAGAKRQCVNARIQGGSATMTKLAMIQLYNDKILRDCQFKLLIGVHDELIGECPNKYADIVADRMTTIMKECMKDICSVPFKCDADIGTRWYYSSYQTIIKKELTQLKEKGLSDSEAFEEIVKNHQESTRDFLTELL